MPTDGFECQSLLCAASSSSASRVRWCQANIGPSCTTQLLQSISCWIQESGHRQTGIWKGDIYRFAEMEIWFRMQSNSFLWRFSAFKTQTLALYLQWVKRSKCLQLGREQRNRRADIMKQSKGRPEEGCKESRCASSFTARVFCLFCHPQMTSTKTRK